MYIIYKYNIETAEELPSTFDPLYIDNEFVYGEVDFNKRKETVPAHFEEVYTGEPYEVEGDVVYIGSRKVDDIVKHVFLLWDDAE